MANQEALLAEYSVLRQDISQAEQMWQTFVGAALAVASVGIVYGFQAQNSLAFFAVSMVLLAGMYIGARNLNRAVLVGTYLYTIVEPKVEGLQWETMLEERRKMGKMESRFPLRHLIDPIVVSLYVLFPLACVLFAWLFIKDYRILNVLLYSCITVIIVVFFVILSLYTLRVWTKKYRSDCGSRWKEIEKQINPTVAAKHMNS